MGISWMTWKDRRPDKYAPYYPKERYDEGPPTSNRTKVVDFINAWKFISWLKRKVRSVK